MKDIQYKRVGFESPQKMYEAITEDCKDLYNIIRGEYIFNYSESGDICTYKLEINHIKSIVQKMIERAEISNVSEVLYGGGYIYAADGCEEAYEYCSQTYQDGFLIVPQSTELCEEFEVTGTIKLKTPGIIYPESLTLHIPGSHHLKYEIPLNDTEIMMSKGENIVKFKANASVEGLDYLLYRNQEDAVVKEMVFSILEAVEVEEIQSIIFTYPNYGNKEIVLPCSAFEKTNKEYITS